MKKIIDPKKAGPRTLEFVFVALCRCEVMPDGRIFTTHCPAAELRAADGTPPELRAEMVERGEELARLACRTLHETAEANHAVKAKG